MLYLFKPFRLVSIIINEHLTPGRCPWAISVKVFQTYSLNVQENSMATCSYIYLPFISSV
ncbi:MAG: hypothetical protein J6Y78_02475 [Paludibacteraceae bacterium]|nr:hypothetical protein [Paludibacteraceae bacterium]